MNGEPRAKLNGSFWAKTTEDGLPGISVRDHCLNVGAVAEALLDTVGPGIRGTLPPNSALLAALHDIGKITLGFQIKCPVWRPPAELGESIAKDAVYSVSDHALVSQFFLQPILKQSGGQLWGVAIGAHHGRPKGKRATLPGPEVAKDWFAERRAETLHALEGIFGAISTPSPDKRFGKAHSDVWLLAGLITVADWIGSNENYFSPNAGVPVDEARELARQALNRIGIPGARLRKTTFSEAFRKDDLEFEPNDVQLALCEAVQGPGLVIVEAPMGCGKTEAALHCAQSLVASGHHHGIYFALPTQVTSNRIHQRVAQFLSNTVAGDARMRLAHAHAWLTGDFDLLLRCSRKQFAESDGDEPAAELREALSWFASSKQALLAPYGVGTIDQALQGMVTIKHFFVRRFALAGKVVILDEIHSYDIYTGTLIGALVRELLNLGCTVIVLSATLTAKRRQELLATADCTEAETPSEYPLITYAATGAQTVTHLRPEPVARRPVQVRAAEISETDTLAELIRRAESGQHVLWIRNTVIEAQDSYRLLRSELCEGDISTGLLHSRFPFTRRQELESEWLERLGPKDRDASSGSILIATQVVEQSVDIDLDFIVSDLAPTDMLIQRVGRLWRHDRERSADHPEFWVRLPDLSHPNPKKALCRSGKVYAPYVLLRSAEVWKSVRNLRLPDDIRTLLEATYADSAENEPAAWQPLKVELDREKAELTSHAEAAMRVFGMPMLDPHDDCALTRRKGPPTNPVVILADIRQNGDEWDLVAPDGLTVTASEFEWRIDVARFLHRWAVRIPRWMLPADAEQPDWLRANASGDTLVACLENERLVFSGTSNSAAYHPDFGVYGDRTNTTQTTIDDWTEDDDEFDY